MKIFAIETSCDETAVALVEGNGSLEEPKFKILADSLYSQAKKHAEFGGVFPSLAKREHAKNLPFLINDVIRKSRISTHKIEIQEETKQKVRELLSREGDLAGEIIKLAEKNKPDIDVIAFTAGPGLEPALWVGINTAKALSLLWNTPLQPANHMEGHIASIFVGENIHIEYPILALLISGGHTELVYADKPLQYKKIGQTKDDALGEAYDKVARLLDLPYPGGPELSRLAEEARGDEKKHGWQFPRPMANSDDLDFSFSGLKTAVMYAIKKHGTLNVQDKKDLALEFEEAVADVLTKKVRDALVNSEAKSFIAAGGVIANKYLREKLVDVVNDFSGIKTYFPDIRLSTDNALMIAAAAYLRILKDGLANNGDKTPASGSLTFDN